MSLTPAPWIANDIDEFTSGAPANWGARYEITSVPDPTNDVSSTFVGFALERDDARLMAEAPNMLTIIRAFARGFHNTQEEIQHIVKAQAILRRLGE